jgi:hypothetical protein
VTKCFSTVRLSYAVGRLLRKDLKCDPCEPKFQFGPRANRVSGPGIGRDWSRMECFIRLIQRDPTGTPVLLRGTSALDWIRMVCWDLPHAPVIAAVAKSVSICEASRDIVSSGFVLNIHLYRVKRLGARPLPRELHPTNYLQTEHRRSRVHVSM